LVGIAILTESEMALFSECMQQYAQKLLDTADIVRDAILQQPSEFRLRNPQESRVAYPRYRRIVMEVGHPGARAPSFDATLSEPPIVDW
jgi:hypothetical protein